MFKMFLIILLIILSTPAELLVLIILVCIKLDSLPNMYQESQNLNIIISKMDNIPSAKCDLYFEVSYII